MKLLLPALLLTACEPQNVESPADTVECGPGTHLDEGLCVVDTAGEPDTGDDTGSGDTNTDTNTGDTGSDTDSGGDTGDTGVACTVAADGSAAYTEIQAAIDAASDGDTVRICAGEYVEVLTISTSLTLIGVDGAEFTVVAADGRGPVVDIRASSTVTMEGLTFQDGYGEEAGAIAVVDTPLVLRDVVFANNESSSATIVTEGGSVDIDGATFTGNSSDYSCGVRVYEAEVYATHVLARDNVNTGGGFVFYVDSGSLELWNSLLVDNAVNTVISAMAGDVKVRNSVIGVPATGISSGQSLDVQNTIFYAWEGWPSTSKGIIASGAANVDYSLFYGLGAVMYKDGYYFELIGTDGNVEVDPEFVDMDGGDFHLDTSSPGIDAGNPAAAYNDPAGTRHDMGAFGNPAGGWPP